MDREAIIQEIAEALVIIENCSEQEIENTKRFLRWMHDDALMDMRDKHRRVLESVV